MSEHVKDVLILQFDEDTRTLNLYDLFTDRERQIIVGFSLEDLFVKGEDEAFQHLGKIIIASMETPGAFLDRHRLEKSLNQS